jgi:hypothetical protein
MEERQFTCKVLGTACTDGRCKKGQCIIEVLEVAESSAARTRDREAREAYIRNHIQEEAVRIARSILRQARKPLTAANIKLVAENKRIREIARSNVARNAEFIFRD